MRYSLIPLVLFAGVLQAFGNSMNAQLKASLQNPWLASLVSFFPIVAFFVVAFAIKPSPLPSANDLALMPWWAPTGGLAGAVAVFMGLMFVSKLGAGPFNGLLITANLLASLLIDHFGLLRMPVHPLNPWRVLGGALMASGIFLISRF
jgi:transporter family-2 protein